MCGRGSIGECVVCACVYLCFLRKEDVCTLLMKYFCGTLILFGISVIIQDTIGLRLIFVTPHGVYVFSDYSPGRSVVILHTALFI